MTDDLWEAWEISSGKPVKEVMSTWTLQTGYPLLSVEENVDGTLSIEQRRFVKDGTADVGLWKIPVAIRGPAEDSKSYILLDSATSPDLPCPKGEWLKLNPGQAGVYRVRYSPPLLAKLAPHVSSLPATDRIGLVGDAFALATAGLTPAVTVLQFLLGFGKRDYPLYLLSPGVCFSSLAYSCAGHQLTRPITQSGPTFQPV